MPYGMDAFMLGIGMLGMCQPAPALLRAQTSSQGYQGAAWVSHLLCGLPS